MSEEIVEIESTEKKQPNRLLMLAVLLLSIAAVSAPILIELMLYGEYGYSKNSTITHVVLPGVWSAITLLIITLIVRTRVVGDIDVVWLRWNRSEVVLAILFIPIITAVYLLLVVLLRKLGLPLTKDLYIWADQHGLAFFVTLTVFKTIICPILEELF